MIHIIKIVLITKLKQIELEHNHHHHSPEMAVVSMIISLSSGFIAFVSMGTIQTIVPLVASGIAIMSGVMAIRYYWYATKEKKQNMKP